MVPAARNIPVPDFGQLGDIVLSLPALQAIRGHISASRITVEVGTLVLVLPEHPTNRTFMPRESRHRIVHGASMGEIPADRAYEAALSIIQDGTGSIVR